MASFTALSRRWPLPAVSALPRLSSSITAPQRQIQVWLGTLPPRMLDLLTVVYLMKYRVRPLHLLGGLGCAFTLVGLVLIGVLTVIIVFADQHLPAWHVGLWLLPMTLVIIGSVFVAIGLLAEALLAQTLPDAPQPPWRNGSISIPNQPLTQFVLFRIDTSHDAAVFVPAHPGRRLSEFQRQNVWVLYV